VKENVVSFETKLTRQQLAEIFQTSVRKRPLKLRVVPFKVFTPTSKDDSFRGVRPDYEVGTIFSLPGSDPAMGSVILSCLGSEGTTRVLLTSTGNMRGRIMSNSLLKHVLSKLQEGDPQIAPEWSTGSR
jgi:hypothetical protein